MSEKNAAKIARIIILIAILLAIAIVYVANSPIGQMSFGMTGQAENALRKEIDSQSQGNIELSDFAKTDVQAMEVFGVKGYALQFAGEVSVMSDGFWLTHNPMAGPTLTFTFSRTPVAFGALNGASQVHVEQRYRIAGTMTGQKSENGWNFNMSECHVVSQ